MTELGKSDGAFSNVPMWGVPVSFLKIESNGPRIMSLMAGVGLNRVTKKRIISTYKPKATVASESYSDTDAGVLTVWADPNQRFWGYWRTVKHQREEPHKPAYHYMQMSPDYVVLQKFDGQTPGGDGSLSLLSSMPGWDNLSTAIRARLQKTMPISDLSPLGVWSKIYQQLANWTQLSDGDRELLAEAVFAIGSATGGDYLVKIAIQTCPKIAPFLAPLGLQKVIRDSKPPVTKRERQGPIGNQTVDPRPAISTMNENSFQANEPNEAASAAEWKRLLSSILITTQRLEALASIEDTSTLLKLATELNELAPQIASDMRLKSALAQLFSSAREAIKWGVASDGYSPFEVLDSEVLDAIEKEWKATLELSRSMADEQTLVADIDRATSESKEALLQYRDTLVKVAHQEAELHSSVQALQGATGASTRITLATRKQQSTHSLALAKTSVLDAEHELLQALCPRRDTTCLEAGVQYSEVVLTEKTPSFDYPKNDIEATATPASAVVEVTSDATSLRTGSHPEPHASAVEAETVAQENGPIAQLPVVNSREALRQALADITVTSAANEASRNERQDEPGETDDPDYSTHAGERCRPIWLALRRNQPGLAYWMAHAIEKSQEPVPVVPPALLAAIALSGHVLLPDGDIAQRMEALYQQFDETWFESSQDIPEAWTQALNLLLFSSLLRAILLCPSSGAAAVAGFLHLSDPNLHQIRQKCEDFSQRSQGFHVDAATFKTPREGGEWQRQIKIVREEARAWLERAPSMKMLFQAASQVWQLWLKSDGLIAKLLTPVAQGQSENLESVFEAIGSVSTTVELERLIQETDRRTIGRRGEEIHTRARSQLSARVGEALQLARRWVALEEQRPKKANVLHQLIDDLRAQVVPLIVLSRKDFEVKSQKDSFGLVSTARLQVVHALNSVADLLNPDVEFLNAEPNPDKVLGQALVMVNKVEVNDRWTPTTSILQLESLLRETVEESPDAQAAFNHRVETHDLLNAQRILDALEAGIEGTVDVDGCRQRLNDELRSHKDMLRRRLHSAEEQVETGLALGLMSEAERAVIECTLVEIEAQVESIRNFRSAFDKLDSVFSELATRKSGKTAEATQRFEKLIHVGLGDQVVAEIRSAIDTGDMLTANEYLQRLESREPIHASVQVAPDIFGRFFPSVAGNIDDSLGKTLPQDIHRAVENGEQVASLDFSLLSPERRKLAADALAAWYAIRRNKKADRSGLRTLTSALGLAVTDLEVKGSHMGRQEYSAHMPTIEDRSICPIPHFGSRAKGHYRVLCVWPSPAQEDVVKMIGDTSLSSATLLLYFGHLTNKKRQEASRLSRAQQRSFILVDETLLLFLLSTSEPPTATLFAASLPFSYSQPFEPTSGVVPTEMFFGRLQELQAVQDQNGRCFMYGGRQLGKTALLRKAERDFHSPQHTRYAKWIDLRAEGIGSNRSCSDIWMLLWRAFIKLGLLGPEVAEPSANVKGRVDRFLEVLRNMLESDPHRRVLLLLDEADSFFENDGQNDFMETRRLKELMTATNWRFKVVFAGLHNVLRTTEQANHPLAHLGEPIKVGPLLAAQEWRDAEDLIRGPFAAAGFSFSGRSLITRILAQTNYYPSLIQLYCHHLLRHMLEAVRVEVRMDGPRYEIRASDVDAVYRRPNLREEIRSKFQLTLQLDTRYEVIAYSLAYEALGGQTSVAEGLSVWDISHKARWWWPAGFERTSDVGFRVLLDEMVGLGVLRRNDEGNYSLRNPNVLLLLGNSDDVSDVLLREREMPVEFEPDSFRARLSSEEGPSRHPLTFLQRRSYAQPHSGVSVVCGSRALGVDRVVEFLLADRDCEHVEVLPHADSRKDFQKTFEAISGNRQPGRTLLIVPPSVQWDLEMVNFALKSTSRLTSKERTLHVLFVADPQKSWLMANSPELLERVNLIELRKWRDGFVRQWLSDLGLTSAQQDRKAIEKQIGYWPALLHELGGSKGATLKSRLEALKERLAGRTTESFDLDFGLDHVEPVNLLKAMSSSKLVETAEDLSILTSSQLNLVNASLAWAKMLSIVSCHADGRWELDTFVARYLTGEISRTT